MARLVLTHDGCNREAARVSNKACQLCTQPHDRLAQPSATVSRDATTASLPLFLAPPFRQDQPPPRLHPAAAGQSSAAPRPETYPLAAPQQPRLRAAPPPAAAAPAAGSLPPSSPPELKARQADRSNDWVCLRKLPACQCRVGEEGPDLALSRVGRAPPARGPSQPARAAGVVAAPVPPSRPLKSRSRLAAVWPDPCGRRKAQHVLAFPRDACSASCAQGREWRLTRPEVPSRG